MTHEEVMAVMEKSVFRMPIIICRGRVTQSAFLGVFIFEEQ